MAKVDKNALYEAVKEPVRLLVLAIVPFGIAWLGGLNYEWALIATAVLRFVDKYLHNLAPKGESGGIVRF